MNIILLSGGSGNRLWPLSNEVRSKQFLKLLKKKKTEPGDSEEFESMLERVYRQIREADPDATLTIASNKAQVASIQKRIGMDLNISVEPARKDTFPAIALATAYLRDVKGVDRDEAVAVCPIDPYVDTDYFRTIIKLREVAQNGSAKLALMGIKPTYPSEKYGYIIPSKVGNDRTSYTFTEKPSAEKAEEYIAAGALWNGGVFAYKLSYVLDKSKELLGTDSYDEMFNHYGEFEKISFDYAVAEKESDLAVLPYDGKWMDIGTWNTLMDVMEEPVVGKGILAEGAEGVHIVNELNLPILACGLKDAIVAASPDGILVATKDTAGKIKPYVDGMDKMVMVAEKSWGSYQVIDTEKESMTIKVTLNPGSKMNYHSHDYRDEVWTAVRGFGTTIVDGMEQEIKEGDVITIAAGCKHTVIAGDSGLQLIEVQLGKDISVDDKHIHKL